MVGGELKVDRHPKTLSTPAVEDLVTVVFRAGVKLSMICVLSHKIQNHAKYQSTHTVTTLPRHTGKPTHTVVLRQYPKGKER